MYRGKRKAIETCLKCGVSYEVPSWGDVFDLLYCRGCQKKGRKNVEAKVCVEFNEVLC